MDPNDPIFALRREIQKLMEDFCDLAAEAPTVEENRALDKVAIELDDVDRALYDAAFIRNDSKISALVQELQKATAKAKSVRDQLKDLKEAIANAREKVKSAGETLQKADTALGKAEQMLVLLKS